MEYWKIPYSPAEIKGTASLVPNKKAEGGGGGASYEQEEKGKKKRRRGIAYNQLDQRGEREREVKKKIQRSGILVEEKTSSIFPVFFLRFANNNIPFLFSQEKDLGIYSRKDE